MRGTQQVLSSPSRLFFFGQQQQQKQGWNNNHELIATFKMPWPEEHAIGYLNSNLNSITTDAIPVIGSINPTVSHSDLEAQDSCFPLMMIHKKLQMITDRETTTASEETASALQIISNEPLTIDPLRPPVSFISRSSPLSPSLSSSSSAYFISNTPTDTEMDVFLRRTSVSAAVPDRYRYPSMGSMVSDLEPISEQSCYSLQSSPPSSVTTIGSGSDPMTTDFDDNSNPNEIHSRYDWSLNVSVVPLPNIERKSVHLDCQQERQQQQEQQQPLQPPLSGKTIFSHPGVEELSVSKRRALSTSTIYSSSPSSSASSPSSSSASFYSFSEEGIKSLDEPNDQTISFN
ncbi:hypothetical protein BCR41DRAFT_365178 [Lobosporangium transversale]|uniref:Uncharacterized protein n=1 Tax=Lobosporangium transversale TaxID=64571 RepID=A0A1Y2G5K8_9FUNG|nr:hypothetical protein BCR41DRAFT_365178 [Lobosporangium transversale]ORY95176.1 hypothetical protein BCR41DRAFT_365178 [Lobosporangium transversale]|eukprot:XP_021875380.1 hypothetical protein BCR41DRAFT_365178 [Lobosporangium transversale]